MSRPSVFALAAALAVLPSIGSAEDMPHQLTPELVRTELALCPTSTAYGTRFVTLTDVDGDGRRDVVLDYSDAECGGGRAPYCDRGGCLLKVYLGAAGGYRKAYEGRVGSWSVQNRGGRPVLFVDGRPLGQ